MKNGLLIVADRRLPASWEKALALEEAARREGRSAVLRDAAELEIPLDFIGHVGEAPFREAYLHILRSIYAVLGRFYEMAEIVAVPPLPDPVRHALSDVEGLRFRVEEAAPAAPAAEAAEPPAAFSSALVVAQDVMPHSTKTSEAILRACRALGLPAVARDGSILRLMADIESQFVADPEAAWAEARERVRGLYGATVREHARPGGPGAAVLALDLNWFFDEALFLDDPAVSRIYSFWFDDPKAWCAYPNTCFPGALDRFQAALRHPKVLHCCYGQGQREELHALGITGTRLSYLAAAPEYLRHRAAPEVTARASFIGNPGLRIPPTPQILALLERGAELPEIREEARRAAMAHAMVYLHKPLAKEPAVRALLAQALVMRAAEPYVSATALLVRAGRDYPGALEAINEAGEILNAAMFVKMTNQFDRPALVHRLWKAGLLDVYSAQGEWEKYGVKSAPDIPFPQLPAAYQRHACHLNGYNSLRDATANEKLFEIAACGRVSVNLLSPDVRHCYADGEVACARSLEEAEAQVRRFLSDPGEALEWGDRARRRTARQHLWTHRLRDLFAQEAGGR